MIWSCFPKSGHNYCIASLKFLILKFMWNQVVDKIFMDHRLKYSVEYIGQKFKITFCSDSRIYSCEIHSLKNSDNISNQ